MDLKKYSDLRDKIKSQDFETKNKDIDTTLNIFSYIGNIGSIFFAFFLLYPALNKAITANLLDNDYSSYLSIITTVVILSGFELLKRKVLSNLSFDIVKNRFKLQRSLISWLLFSIAMIGISFYFSLKGAIEFASTSDSKNIAIENNVNKKIDSLENVFQERKNLLILDNNSYRESNRKYRDKIADSPLNYRTVRNELQELIDDNNNTINENEERIKELDDELNSIIETINKKETDKLNEIEGEDMGNILLFLIISISIEIVIILGIYFDKYYDYNVYLINMGDLETIFKKRDRYKTMIKFIFKEGMVSHDQPIMGKSKLIQLISEKSTINSPKKFVDEFINDMEYLNILKLSGKRRYTKTSYEEALDKIDKFDDTLRLLEKLN